GNQSQKIFQAYGLNAIINLLDSFFQKRALKKSCEGHKIVTLSLSKGGKPFKIRFMLRQAQHDIKKNRLNPTFSASC
ncbi:MAG: hypothetical protein ACE5G9_07510, partial [Nitrospinales bacterium]